MLQITLQRPTVVAEIGFLLAVTKFFVPTMAISGVSPIPFVSQDIYLEGKLLPESFAWQAVFLYMSCRECHSTPCSNDGIGMAQM